MPIRVDKIDGFTRIYDETLYLTLFASENYDAIYNRIRCLISLKYRIAYIFSHYFVKMKVDSYDYLHVEKRLAIHNVISLNQFLIKIKITAIIWCQLAKK